MLKSNLEHIIQNPGLLERDFDNYWNAKEKSWCELRIVDEIIVSIADNLEITTDPIKRWKQKTSDRFVLNEFLEHSQTLAPLKRKDRITNDADGQEKCFIDHFGVKSMKRCQKNSLFVLRSPSIVRFM